MAASAIAVAIVAAGIGAALAFDAASAAANDVRGFARACGATGAFAATRSPGRTTATTCTVGTLARGSVTRTGIGADWTASATATGLVALATVVAYDFWGCDCP